MSGSRSWVKRVLSSFSSLWAVECGDIGLVLWDWRGERLNGEARVEDLLVLLPGEIFDFIVATAGVPVSGDSAWVLEFGEVFGETEAEAVLSEATNARDAIEASRVRVFSV